MNWAKVCKQVQNMLGKSRAKKDANEIKMGLPLMLIIYGKWFKWGPALFLLFNLLIRRSDSLLAFHDGERINNIISLASTKYTQKCKNILGGSKVGWATQEMSWCYGCYWFKWGPACTIRTLINSLRGKGLSHNNATCSLTKINILECLQLIFHLLSLLWIILHTIKTTLYMQALWFKFFCWIDTFTLLQS